jgi:hypothetical protein
LTAQLRLEAFNAGGSDDRRGRVGVISSTANDPRQLRVAFKMIF